MKTEKYSLKHDNRNAARIILWTLTAALMALIFVFSAQNAEGSTSMSGGTIETILRIVMKNFDSLPAESREAIIESYQLLARKTAHFLAYMALGMLTSGALFQYELKMKTRIAAAMAICVLYAASDEIHQLFVPGRSGMAIDVLLDSCGAATGVLLVFLLRRLWKIKKRRGARP